MNPGPAARETLLRGTQQPTYCHLAGTPVRETAAPATAPSTPAVPGRGQPMCEVAALATAPPTAAVPSRVQPPSPSAWARHPAAADAAFPTYGDGSEHFPEAGAETPEGPATEEDIAEEDEEDEEDADLQAALQVGTQQSPTDKQPTGMCCVISGDAVGERRPLCMQRNAALA